MLKKLAGAIREYKLPSILAPLTVAVEVVAECLIPFITAQLINAIETGSGMPTVLKYGFGLLGMALLSLTFGILAGYFCSVASCGFAKNLRHDLFYKIGTFSFSNIDSFSTSSLVTRLTTDVSNVQQAYMMLVRTAIRCPFMLVFAFVMSIRLGGPIALVFAGVLPLLAFGLFAIIHHVMPLFRRLFKKYDKLNESVQENVAGMRVVKSFVREDHEREKFGAASDELCRNFTHAEKILALNDPIMRLCMNISMLLLSYLSARIIIGNFVPDDPTSMGVGNFTGMITYSMQVLMSMMMVSMVFVMVTMAIESAHRITEVLSTESDLKNPENPLYTLADGRIEFEGVSFRYAATAANPALQNVNLSIASGETVGIIGGTGSSKSTLISLISRLYDASEGMVRVGGEDVRAYDLDTLRNGVSVVLQKNLLFSGTIKENLRWGDPNATDEELEHACRLACAHDFVSAFPDGYDTYIEQGGTKVSGGQKQRLCIARALLKKPKILILDDSTSAVDTHTDAMIRRAMREEIPNTTKIIIAQRVASVQDADRIVVLDGGRIESCGTHEELLVSSPIYREVFESQTRAGGDD
ncbi:MAG: ABC transporter ATP-binding protein [Clostridia bacterium]|nr:ABC transporter ATP-binding protein [Clostridia bacterium]